MRIYGATTENGWLEWQMDCCELIADDGKDDDGKDDDDDEDEEEEEEW